MKWFGRIAIKEVIRTMFTGNWICNLAWCVSPMACTRAPVDAAAAAFSLLKRYLLGSWLVPVKNDTEASEGNLRGSRGKSVYFPWIFLSLPSFLKHPGWLPRNMLMETTPARKENEVLTTEWPTEGIDRRRAWTFQRWSTSSCHRGCFTTSQRKR